MNMRKNQEYTKSLCLKIEGEKIFLPNSPKECLLDICLLDFLNRGGLNLGL